jgi:hypothetical protein
MEETTTAVYLGGEFVRVLANCFPILSGCWIPSLECLRMHRPHHRWPEVLNATQKVTLPELSWGVRGACRAKEGCLCRNHCCILPANAQAPR